MALRDFYGTLNVRAPFDVPKVLFSLHDLIASLLALAGTVPAGRPLELNTSFLLLILSSGMQEELFSLLKRMGRVKRIHTVGATPARVARFRLSQYCADIIRYYERHPRPVWRLKVASFLYGGRACVIFFYHLGLIIFLLLSSEPDNRRNPEVRLQSGQVNTRFGKKEKYPERIR